MSKKNHALKMIVSFAPTFCKIFSTRILKTIIHGIFSLLHEIAVSLRFLCATLILSFSIFLETRNSSGFLSFVYIARTQGII